MLSSVDELGTPPFSNFTAYGRIAFRTCSDGQLGWGGTPSIINQRCPKVSSARSEIMTTLNTLYVIYIHMMELINIGNIPDEIYIELTENDHNRLWSELSKHFNVKEIADKYGISVRNLYKYKEGCSGYPAKDLKKLLKFSGTEITSLRIKPQRNGKSVGINIPLNLTEDFSEFLGYLFGDGGIDIKLAVHYTTGEMKFAERFDFLVNKIFGNVEKSIHRYNNRVTFYYPKVLGILLNGTLDIPYGNKVDSDISIPDKILLNMTEGMKKCFIKGFYDCDGDKKQIRIIQAGKSLSEPPKILLQQKQMLESLGFESILIKPSSIYLTLRATRRRWVLQVLNPEEKKKFISMFLNLSCHD